MRPEKHATFKVLTKDVGEKSTDIGPTDLRC